MQKQNESVPQSPASLKKCRVYDQILSGAMGKRTKTRMRWERNLLEDGFLLRMIGELQNIKNRNLIGGDALYKKFGRGPGSSIGNCYNSGNEVPGRLLVKTRSCLSYRLLRKEPDRL